MDLAAVRSNRAQSVMIRVALPFGALLAACGEPTGTTPPPPPPPAVECSSVAAVQLAVGAHQMVDPAQTGGCLTVPEAGAGGAEYVVVLASTSPTRSSTGVTSPYVLRASGPATAAPPATAAAAPASIADVQPGAALAFHDRLRRYEAELALSAAPQLRAERAPAALVPPTVGDVRTFKVCANLQCTSFTDVAATARYVGTEAAIYMDNTVPQNDPLQDADFQDLGATFDTYHYPISAASFGDASDIDGNDRIVILMTDAVNDLTPNCSNGRVLGYFFGLDLAPGSTDANSNQAEIFYTLVPSPATTQCQEITRSAAVNNLKPTLIHELQHMISWNQRVLVRGASSEELWLNEALSHFAEELGGRLIPNQECVAAGFTSCRSQYISSNIFNTYDYLTNPEATHLIFPGSSQGSLEERGAAWFFLRWTVDQFAADPILGTTFTRQLVQTTALGASNVVAVAGESFARMVVEWLLAAYLDDLDGFTADTDRLRFESWGLRAIWLNPANAQFFSEQYPLRPPSTSGSYTRQGTLRGGTGTYLLLQQPANGAAIEVQATRNTQGDPLDPALAARFGIARVR